MNDKQKLKLALHYVENDSAWEGVEMDIAQKRKVTDREKQMLKTLGNLYELLHPSKRCSHPNWVEKHEEIFKELKK